MKLLVHTVPNDPRVKAYVDQRKAADPKLVVETGPKEVAKLDEKVIAEVEALISGELPNINELCQQYKEQGVRVTTLGKYVAPPKEQKAEPQP